MSQDEFCSNCKNTDTCKAVYEQLGKVKGPSIAFKAFAVFLMPIVVFIVALALIQNSFPGIISSPELRTILNFVVGFGAAFVFVLILRIINVRMEKRKGSPENPCTFEGDIKSNPKVN